MNVNKDSIKDTLSVKMVVIVLAILLGIYLLMHYLFKKAPPPMPAPTVVVQKPQSKTMAEYVTQTGTTVAYNSVNLVARVEGYLDAIKFTDGTFIKKGQELFIIQPQPYMDQLKGAQASVAAQKAMVAYDKAEYQRQQRMYKENATSLNNVEKWSAKTQESSAELDKAEANEDIAAINYSYTHVLAPFDGRIGRHLVDSGNLVGHGEATSLATIEQISPLYVYFNLNELDLIKLRDAARTYGFKPKDIGKVPVFISMQNDVKKHKATLDFVNTGLNASTGTMELRAVLKNENFEFVPGLFVQVRVAVSKEKEQLTIPSTAILYDQIGPYIYTVDKDNIVQLQRVGLGSAEQGMQAISSGLSADDNVIIIGLQNATPGNKVLPRQQSTEKTAK